MVPNPTRRSVLGIVTSGIATFSGCVEYLRAGCEIDSKYLLILTEVGPDTVRTESIEYGSLTAPEQRLIERALDEDHYETCPQDVSESESVAFDDFGDRVRERSQNGYAYLEYQGRYYQIGLVVSAVHYARTEYESTGTSDTTP